MYRVMIVDDEPLILAGIASLLDWKEYGCEISGKAANMMMTVWIIMSLSLLRLSRVMVS